MLESKAISMLSRMAEPIPGTPNGCVQLLNVKPSHV